MAAKLDRAIEHGLNIDWSDLEDFGRIVDEIVVTPATTIEGLCVKARVRCWALGSAIWMTMVNSQRMRTGWLSLSCVISSGSSHPDLERPGALKRLVEEIEEPAVKS